MRALLIGCNVINWLPYMVNEDVKLAYSKALMTNCTFLADLACENTCVSLLVNGYCGNVAG